MQCTHKVPVNKVPSVGCSSVKRRLGNLFSARDTALVVATLQVVANCATADLARRLFHHGNFGLALWFRFKDDAPALRSPVANLVGPCGRGR